VSNHISEDLPRLLTGEAGRDDVLAAAAHLRTCPDCQQELVSAVIAHASLTSAHRFAPEIVAPRMVEQHDGEDAPAGPLPDLSAIFAQVRAEAAPPAPGTHRRWRPLYGIAAAAAGVLIGGSAVALVVDNGGSSSDTVAGRRVELGSFGVGQTTAVATVTAAGQMKIDATSLPDPGSRKRYEVWLTNSQRSQMQPIGWIGNDGKATLTIPADLMGQYQDIEVSVQDVGADGYNYSGTSVLRGSYA
jgi:hypothetical protein